MNTMLQLTRSTVLADAHHMRRAPSNRPVVRVGGIASASRATMSNAANAIHGTYGSLGVRVGADAAPGTTVVVPVPTTVPGVAIVPQSQPSSGVVGAIGKTAAYVLLATMIAGPPAVGYLLGGKVGLAIGAVVAAPMAILFGLSIFDSLPQPRPVMTVG